jgi:AcrR family transcriptional regulator
MHEWIPLPGSVRARLIDAGIHQFEAYGFDGANVTELASEAGVTTGALYHHFKSKLGLYLVIRDEMDKRMYERMEGAAAALGGVGRDAARAALLVSFDAAVRFGVTRILSEPRPGGAPDVIATTLERFVPRRVGTAGVMLAAVWRGALAAVAAGVRPARARVGLVWLLDVGAAA